MQVLQPHCARTMVWAPLRSLAATCRISFDFFSCWYLDVSVPNVGLSCATLLTQGSFCTSTDGVAPFGDLRIKG